jgi:hydrogen peroxide-dependent heme synthase
MTDVRAPQHERPLAYPPETTEGWYTFHQILAWDRAARRAIPVGELPSLQHRATEALRAMETPSSGGWSAVVPLVGSRGDVMLIHFRPTLDEIGAVQRAFAAEALFDSLRPVYSFLSVTEAGLYHATAQLVEATLARGGKVGDEEYQAAMAERVAKERASAHVQRRLFPTQPEDMPYVCFYPMSKKRDVGANWYALPVEERSRLMWSHGLTGRGYHGRIVQVITGAIGFDAWEWGVTLFAKDPLEFKKIVSDMRFDEVSAEYAEFGEFFVGKRVAAGEWLGTGG